MADVNRGNRPLSPFMLGQYYRFQITSVTSILHRISGVAMAGAGVLVVWWFLAAAIGPGYFATADWVLTSWLGTLVLVGALVALWYHFLNGIRHLRWDIGHGFGLASARKSGLVALVGSVALTVATLVVVALV